jgi:putative PIN family toxin of toxin-antitoxin system
MRLVLDTSVIVKAVRNFRGASAALIAETARGRIRALVSTPLWLEYEAVVKRPEHWVWPGFDEQEADRFLDTLSAIATPVSIQFRWRGLLGDPDDDMVLETAINGGADAIVTFNEQDFASARRQLGLDLRRPADILALLRDRP